MKTQFLLIIALILSSCSYAQLGYSSGTMGMMQSEYYNKILNEGNLTAQDKLNIREGALNFLLPQQVVPEEILNYHHHLIALPAKGKKVNVVPEVVEHPLVQNHYLMQIGIASDTILPTNRKPTGIMYVLDISGSMDDGKLEQAKKAIIASLERLYPNDYFGITLFDNESEILIPYELFGGRKADIISKVEGLGTRGGTDILKGLNTGIDEMMSKNFPEHPKSILLLTDGNTNVGVTDKAKLIAEYQKKTNESVRITTLGIGIDLHEDLLRDLSAQTHGQFHFIERYEDIQKTCVNEFGSLAFPIGKNVSLNVQIPACFNVKQVYGASSWTIKNNVLEIPVADINYFLTQVVILDLELSQDIKMDVAGLKTTLNYTDYTEGKAVIITEATTNLTDENGLLYHDVVKNYLIADWAWQLKTIADAYHNTRDIDQLKIKTSDLLANPLIGYKPISDDKDILRIKDIFEKVAMLVS